MVFGSGLFLFDAFLRSSEGKAERLEHVDADLRVEVLLEESNVASTDPGDNVVPISVQSDRRVSPESEAVELLVRDPDFDVMIGKFLLNRCRMFLGASEMNQDILKCHWQLTRLNLLVGRPLFSRSILSLVSPLPFCQTPIFLV